MDSEDEEDDPKPEKLPIYRKGKEIFDMEIGRASCRERVLTSV
jgi:hypothetical protein